MRAHRIDSRIARPRARAALALLALAPLAGCATKRDVRDLRDEIVRLRAHQDSTAAALRMESRALGDSIRGITDLLMRLRGDLGNELAQLEQQHLQIQELTGQSQRRLSELQDQMTQRLTRLTAPAPDSGAATPEAAGEVEQLYRIGSDNLQRGATGTARRAFEEIVQQHQDSPLAPDAQVGLAETYYADKDYDRAMRELERVVEMFPNSERAPAALYRAGVIAREQGNIQKARAYFRRVVAGYPKSDAAKQAAEELRHIR